MTVTYNLVFETIDSSPDISIDFKHKGDLVDITSKLNKTSINEDKSDKDSVKIEKSPVKSDKSLVKSDIEKSKSVEQKSGRKNSEKKGQTKATFTREDTLEAWDEKIDEKDLDIEKDKGRARERGTREPSDIIIETYYSKMNYAGAVGGAISGAVGGAVGISGSTSISRKCSGRPGFSRENTPASGSKDFPPLPGQKAESREGSISAESKESTPSERSRQKSSKESTPVEPDTINFISGNPFVEVTKGILHLFKDKTDPEFLNTEMMCMYGVPAQHKTSEILQFTAPCHPDLEYMRIIHDGSPNQYIVLLKFRSSASATEFYEVYNGRPYNNMEPDICSVLPVSSVEHCKESEYYPNPDRCTELPYCTICLERMDESVSTVLTILCNHKFHTGCIAQWEDPTCPVCRHVQTPEMVAEQVCSNCQSSSDLWICLVCGFVGCGRYAGGHAHQHFLETQHCYSMELGHNRVWDYVGDNFVHRLVQNTSDGKLVEQEGGGGEDQKHCRENVGGVNVDSDEKMDSLQLEYTYLLTSQLESQREYFEGKLSRVQEETTKQIQDISIRCRGELKDRDDVQKQLDVMSKDRAKMEAKINHLTTKISQLSSNLEEEKQLNRSLQQNQGDWQIKLKKTEIELSVTKEQKEKEIIDLKEQVHDLMFFLEAQNKIKDSPLCTEMQEGTVVVREEEAEEGESPRKQGKRGRRRGH